MSKKYVEITVEKPSGATDTFRLPVYAASPLARALTDTMRHCIIRVNGRQVCKPQDVLDLIGGVVLADGHPAGSNLTVAPKRQRGEK